jgi:hypothetical protein
LYIVYRGETNKSTNNVLASIIGAMKKVKLDNVIVTKTGSLDSVVREVLSENISPSERKDMIDLLLGLSPA